MNPTLLNILLGLVITILSLWLLSVACAGIWFICKRKKFMKEDKEDDNFFKRPQFKRRHRFKL